MPFSIDPEITSMVEHELYRTGGSKVSITLAKMHAHIGNSSIVIVCSSFYENCYSMRSIAFKKHYFIIALTFIARTLNCTIDIVLRHVHTFSILNDCTKSGITVWIWSAFLHGHHNIFSNSSERLSHCRPTFHLTCFSKFECSSHKYLNLV